jgi:D-alanyl-lipoteichoic acid acyltransferase DltB (MBOAT superfamily)
VFDIAWLFVFKYATVVSKNIALLFGGDCFILNIALPLGISFYTFQIMSYVFDVYYKKVAAQKNLVNLALYISLFPALIAGPIVRYKTIAAEIDGRVETWEDFTSGMTRFVIGLAKKVLIAYYAGLIVDQIFAFNGNTSAASAWLGVIAYNVQIYFDFSGYSDMAIGIGRMFGFHFLENFNYPYIAKSMTEYWQRWHISLGSWFRDYVFTPLNIINRKKKWGMIFAMFVTWSLTGIWHGANWTFVLWGLSLFLLITLEWKTRFPARLKWFAHVYLLFVITVFRALTRSESITAAGQYMGAMFGFGSMGLVDYTFWSYLLKGKWILLLGCVLSMPVVPWCRDKLCRFNTGSKIYRLAASVGIILLFSLSVLVCIKSTYSPFIYFNF